VNRSAVTVAASRALAADRLRIGDAAGDQTRGGGQFEDQPSRASSTPVIFASAEPHYPSPPLRSSEIGLR